MYISVTSGSGQFRTRHLQKAELVDCFLHLGEGKARFVLSRHGKVFVDEEKELNGENRFVWEVDHPALWSAEVPNLYDLMITVTGKDGAVTELIPEKSDLEDLR